jgi:hypothetical protein
MAGNCYVTYQHHGRNELEAFCIAPRHLSIISSVILSQDPVASLNYPVLREQSIDLLLFFEDLIPFPSLVPLHRASSLRLDLLELVSTPNLRER